MSFIPIYTVVFLIKKSNATKSLGQDFKIDQQFIGMITGDDMGIMVKQGNREIHTKAGEVC